MSTQRFSSFLTSLMATAGLAIGIGNVWRFPYMMGSHGGSAFLVLFIVCIVFLSLPALMAEWALARHTRQGTIGAFTATFGPVYGRITGYALLFCITIAGSYYLVVIGNVFYSGYFSVIHGFSEATAPAFKAGLVDNYLQLFLALFVLLTSAFIIQRGVRRGIEFVSNLFVPFFFLVSCYLVYEVLSLPGATTHLSVFLQVDFSRIGFTEVFAAMGQAYFSIGLGATLTLIYGSYLRDDIKLPKLALMTCVSDTGAALLAALYLIPALLVFGMDLTAGPTLLFETLPGLFGILPGGRLFGSLMLIALFLVTLLSYVAVLEAVVSGLLGDTAMARFSKTGLLGDAAMARFSKTGLLGDAAMARFSKTGLLVVLVVIQALLAVFFTFNPENIAIADLLFGSAGLMIGGCLALLALAWGIGRAHTVRQVFGDSHALPASIYFFWIKWIAPGILILVLLGTLYETLT